MATGGLPQSNTRGPPLKLHSMPSIMTMKQSRNWSALLRKLSVPSQPVEIPDGSDDVCTRIMPRKS
jgi:hypothetical protein